MKSANLCSHGVGQSPHEAPNEMLPFYDKRDKRVLKEGKVITIEPFLSAGAEYVVEQPDGWTLCVPDRGYAAQHPGAAPCLEGIKRNFAQFRFVCVKEEEEIEGGFRSEWDHFISKGCGVRLWL